MSCPENKPFLIPIHRNEDGSTTVDMTQFGDYLRKIESAADCYVVPQSLKNICVFTFAAAIYSIPVEKNVPMQNVIIHRPGPAQEATRSLEANKISAVSKVEPPFFEVGIPKCRVVKCPHDIWSKYDLVTVGGTFDRLHAGHRLLLTIASWTAQNCLWVGITGSNLLQHKKHVDLIASFEERARNVRAFVQKTRPELPEVRVQELTDSAGAAGVDPSVEALVISKETMKGAIAVNEQRKSAGLKELELVVVDIVFQSSSKVSSTALREADAQARAMSKRR